ncbi:MAG: N-acetylglucosamine-6-phosphate deacetylase, partial [Gemmobacter sp.]
MARRLRIHAETLHDGSPASPQQGRVVEIAGDRIVAVGAGTVADADLSFPVVAPGFIDLQINGGGGVLFNDSPDPATLDRIAGAARRGGAAHVLPTFITAPDDAYLAAIRAVAEATASGMPGILGLHLEGPFLSPDRPGIHDRTAIRPLTHADVELLGAPRPFPLLVTLAPERQPAGQLDRLAAAGVILFA